MPANCAIRKERRDQLIEKQILNDIDNDDDPSHEIEIGDVANQDERRLADEPPRQEDLEEEKIEANDDGEEGDEVISLQLFLLPHDVFHLVRLLFLLT